VAVRSLIVKLGIVKLANKASGFFRGSVVWAEPRNICI
jgi:hypothetical protein